MECPADLKNCRVFFYVHLRPSLKLFAIKDANTSNHFPQKRQRRCMAQTAVAENNTDKNTFVL